MATLKGSIQGFYVNGLRDAYRDAWALAQKSDNPVPYYVLAKIIDEVVRGWDGRPVDAGHAANVRDVLLPAIERVVDAMAARPESGAADELRLLVEARMRIAL